MATTNLPATRGHKTEDTGLTQRDETTTELQVTQGSTRARAEVEGMLVIAKKFPRNENAAYAGIIGSCKRKGFAEKARYKFPRGNTDVIGASINMARELKRLWGNMQSGYTIISDDEEERQIRAFAWDTQTNAHTVQEAAFKKLVQRKVGKGDNAVTKWVKPDERDLRELTNKHGSTAERNCILALLPKDFVDDALDQCKKTMVSDASEDLAGSQKKIVVAFSEIGVPAAELDVYLGHPLSQANAHEIADLREIFCSIRDGNSRWHEYVADKKPDTAPSGPVGSGDLTEPKGSAAKEAAKEDGVDVESLLIELDSKLDQCATAQAVMSLEASYLTPGHTLGADTVAKIKKQCSIRKAELKGDK